jgi:hypothetical protein
VAGCLLSRPEALSSNPSATKKSAKIAVNFLMAPIESVIRRHPDSLCLVGRIHCRTHGCKGSLLKVREEKYKGEHGGHRGVCQQREGAFLSQVLLKHMLI